MAGIATAPLFLNGTVSLISLLFFKNEKNRVMSHKGGCHDPFKIE
jgi:hypothetical protein